MDFLKKLNEVVGKATEKAGEFAEYASDKAGDLTQQAKFKMEESKLKGQLPTLYKELGEKVYNASKENFNAADLEGMVSEYKSKINQVFEGLDEIKEKIAALAEDDIDILGQASDKVEDGVEAAKEKVEDGVETVKEKFGEGVEAATEKAEEVKDAFADKVEDVKDSAEELAENAQDKVDDFKRNF